MVRHISQHHTLVVRMRPVSTSSDLGHKIVLAEKEVGGNVWKIFRRLGPKAEATEEELVTLMDREIPGLGQIAKVFGTHGDTMRRENVWEVLKFFMNVHPDLQQSPRKAWENRKFHDDVLQTAQLYGHKVPR